MQCIVACVAWVLAYAPLMADGATSRPARAPREAAASARGAAADPLPTIEWKQETLQLIAPGGDYGRIARLADGTVACAYDAHRQMWLRRSTDHGATWGEPIPVASEADCWLTNADLLPLRDGTVLYFWNERPIAAVQHRNRKAPPGVLTRPFRIRMARSIDMGRTWSAAQTLYTAGMSYADGCWEPAGLQLPSGEIHLYFANEFPFTHTVEQEIALLRSSDGGRIWSRAERVAYRSRYRDGMPAPLLLAGGGGIVLAIEDNGLSGDRFKPAIVHTPEVDDWSTGPVGGESPERWGALAEPLPPEWYGGAPCLRQLPSGETLLSFQESADGSLERCRMVVCVGDAGARNFRNKSYPLPQDRTGNQAWNALFVKNARTVTAISTATINGTRGIWIIDGRLVSAVRTTRPSQPAK